MSCVPQKGVFKDFCCCHTYLSFGMTPTIPWWIKLWTFANFRQWSQDLIKKQCSSQILCCKVGVLPKEELAGASPPILLLVWQWQRFLRHVFVGRNSYTRTEGGTQRMGCVLRAGRGPQRRYQEDACESTYYGHNSWGGGRIMLHRVFIILKDVRFGTVKIAPNGENYCDLNTFLSILCPIMVPAVRHNVPLLVLPYILWPRGPQIIFWLFYMPATKTFKLCHKELLENSLSASRAWDSICMINLYH